MLDLKVFKDGYEVSGSALAKSEKNDCVVERVLMRLKLIMIKLMHLLEVDLIERIGKLHKMPIV